MGSSALLGRLTAADLATPAADTGRTLVECMHDVGVEIERVKKGEMMLDPKSLCAWVELHSEKGPVLVARELPTGSVTGIRSNICTREVAGAGAAGYAGGGA